jgi:hypothetical protein
MHLFDINAIYIPTGFVIIVKRRVLQVEQELIILPDHPSSPLVVCGVRVVRSLVFHVVFCRSLYFCPCVVCPIYGILLFLWYLQTFFTSKFVFCFIAK